MFERLQRKQLKHAVFRKALAHADPKTAQTFNCFARAGKEISRIDMLQAELGPEQDGIGIALEPFIFHRFHIDDLGQNDKVTFRFDCRRSIEQECFVDESPSV